MKGGGLGIVGVVQIIFLVLKLAGVVAWSWPWVLAPLWISLSVSLVCGLVAGLFILIGLAAGGIAMVVALLHD